MKKLVLAVLVGAGALVAASGGASAQVYYSGPGYSVQIGPQPAPYYRRHHHRYYAQDYGYRERHYRPRRGKCPPHYTVQDGVCKPYRGY